MKNIRTLKEILKNPFSITQKEIDNNGDVILKAINKLEAKIKNRLHDKKMKAAFKNCKFKYRDHVIPSDYSGLGNKAPKGVTVWEIYDVTLKHGGTDYYHCRAKGYGTISIYEGSVVKVTDPVSNFYKRIEK